MYQLRHALGDLIKERYTVSEVLGTGAFGTVYRVEETIGARTVTLACKEMHVLDDPDLSGDERSAALQMFQEEAYLLQTLRHPHIPAAYFEQEKGIWLACPMCGKVFRGMRSCPEHGNVLQVVRERYYLIMDFLDGPDLEELLLRNSGQPLGEEPVLDWALQICDALQAVHAKGLSHRDIKPANIKIQGPSQQAMLIDFGLVKAAGVAGTYGTVLKTGSTGTGTIGYAPESAEERAHPDARTDILALGMTMYRLLTCRDPTDDNDLALMRKSTPGNLNLRLSGATDEIVVKMTRINAADRYDDIKLLRTEMQAARYPVKVACPHCGHEQRSALGPAADSQCERCGRPLLVASTTAVRRRPAPDDTKPPPAPRHNPHEARLAELWQQIKQPAPGAANAFAFTGDARIAQLEETITKFARSSVGATALCPGCRSHELLEVDGQPSGRCPLCDGTQLMRRQWEAATCPQCRVGTLSDHCLAGTEMFCAVCRRQPLRREERRRFGLVPDEWGVCAACGAEFDIVGSDRARLVSFRDDPFGTGRTHAGATLLLDEWRRLAGRSARTTRCASCQAQWDIDDAGRLRLTDTGNSSQAPGSEPVGTVHSRLGWSKKAQNIAAECGNLHCPSCCAEFDYDRDSKTLSLAREGKIVPDWAQTIKHEPQPLPTWYCAAAGKKSMRVGSLCPSCGTEFDSVGTELQLVASQAALLMPCVGQQMTLQDWQRTGAGLPTGRQAHLMRAELQKLLAERQAEETRHLLNQRNVQSGAEAEFKELLKLSIVGGYIPFRRLSSYASSTAASADLYVSLPGSAKRGQLHAYEQVLWESPTYFCTARMVSGGYNWVRGPQGTLLVTNERLVFNVPQRTDRQWDRELNCMESVELHSVQGETLVVVALRGQHELVGFSIKPVTYEAVMEGRKFDLVFSPQELLKLLLQKITV